MFLWNAYFYYHSSALILCMNPQTDHPPVL
uniref:Uncharacterized protein n=1 Tax=Anguilla anguilla TaxID=7936 RepID=A0A0E9R779_ANGAN